eukprot:TRINITY_DN23441_c0_g1_i1.p1 TRINITY_DN23441_c0_g1~~TRINITY_DN23441_c0_g1_i1.p1  ORF type:complete len:208 (+),score=39.73 TRINITY_DN23441_c0_g1_i1:194-817(+)
MAINPDLDSFNRPVPFVNEAMVLARDGIEFEVDKIPAFQGGRWHGRGTVYLSNIRMVLVANSPQPPVFAFDIPLLFVENEKFSQPIFACNNLSGLVTPVQSSPEPPPERPPRHTFKVLFKEGGVGTFIPVFFNILHGLRASMPPPMPPQPAGTGEAAPDSRPEPLPSTQLPVDEIVRCAYVDPNDPSRLYLQQPYEAEEGERRQSYY